MTEVKLKERNDRRILQLHPALRPKVETIIHRMRFDFGHRARVQDAWRSIKQQEKYQAGGTSKLKWGFHNATAKDGTPEALACDIIDDNKLYDNILFWFHLSYCAKGVGMDTGILWGLDANHEQGTLRALERAVFLKMEDLVPEEGPPVRVGWDPGHCQVADISLVSARRGKRPLITKEVA